MQADRIRKLKEQITLRLQLASSRGDVSEMKRLSVMYYEVMTCK